MRYLSYNISDWLFVCVLILVFYFRWDCRTLCWSHKDFCRGRYSNNSASDRRRSCRCSRRLRVLPSSKVKGGAGVPACGNQSKRRYVNTCTSNAMLRQNLPWLSTKARDIGTFELDTLVCFWFCCDMIQLTPFLHLQLSFLIKRAICYKYSLSHSVWCVA